jgi:hypothetical protein
LKNAVAEVDDADVSRRRESPVTRTNVIVEHASGVNGLVVGDDETPGRREAGKEAV